MEEKRVDSKTIIAFALMFVLLLWVMYNNAPTKEEIQKESTQTQTEKTRQEVASSQGDNTYQMNVLPQTSTSDTTSVTLQNKLVKIKINSRGGQISQVLLKSFDTYQKEKVYLVKDGNSDMFLQFITKQQQQINTQNLTFAVEKFQKDGVEGAYLRVKFSDDSYLEYEYRLPENSYMVDFSVHSKGLSQVVNESKPIALHWQMKQRRMDKSLSYENRYSQLTAQYDGDEIVHLSVSGEDTQTEKKVNWVAFKQHLFTSILISDKPWSEVEMHSKNLDSGSEEGEFTKDYRVSIPMSLNANEISHKLKIYYGPSDYRLLQKYSSNYDLTDLISFGWGIFGWLNRWVFLPLFDFLNRYLSVGISIILMTIIVRLVLSPVVYKSYISQAKMKVLRPEINQINEKYKDQMKRQQETMQLYREAGVNPMSGCIPALLQLPIFLALFNFFPNVFSLRQEPFLWASDLSSYDSIYELPFSIPFYGSHVSLFPILASIAILIYSMMTMSQQTQPQQPGMPNMKFMMYLSPVMMLFFFNNYASGLSLYYFISNLITIFIMLVIKYWIIDEDKIHAQIQENKKKPKKEGRFQRKMREMMEQAEAQSKR